MEVCFGQDLRVVGGEMLRLLLKLLYAVLAEEPVASGVGFEDGFDGMDFADGH